MESGRARTTGKRVANGHGGGWRESGKVGMVAGKEEISICRDGVDVVDQANVRTCV